MDLSKETQSLLKRMEKLILDLRGPLPYIFDYETYKDTMIEGDFPRIRAYMTQVLAEAYAYDTNGIIFYRSLSGKWEALVYNENFKIVKRSYKSTAGFRRVFKRNDFLGAYGIMVEVRENVWKPVACSLVKTFNDIIMIPAYYDDLDKMYGVELFYSPDIEEDEEDEEDDWN